MHLGIRIPGVPPSQPALLIDSLGIPADSESLEDRVGGGDGDLRRLVLDGDVEDLAVLLKSQSEVPNRRGDD